jgi:thioredoxin-like negative regulator of GroEL
MAYAGDAIVPEQSILSEEEFEALKIESDSKQLPLLLQLGSAACTRCPAFHGTVAALKETHQFAWVYGDAHHQDTELPELFDVKQLPAYVLYTPGNTEPVVVANASPEQVEGAVKAACAPVFTTDADF